MSFCYANTLCIFSRGLYLTDQISGFGALIGDFISLSNPQALCPLGENVSILAIVLSPFLSNIDSVGHVTTWPLCYLGALWPLGINVKTFCEKFTELVL